MKERGSERAPLLYPGQLPMPSANVSEAAEELFLDIRSRAVEAYRSKIKTDSIPLKNNVDSIGILDPSGFHRTSITGREQAALIASCICNRIEISAGAVIPRSFKIEDQVTFIEKGASQDIVASASAGWIPSAEPLSDRFVLSRELCDEIRSNFDMAALQALQDTLYRQGSL
jgi:hypothetical protein